jgi:chromosome segregation ATPase
MAVREKENGNGQPATGKAEQPKKQKTTPENTPDKSVVKSDKSAVQKELQKQQRLFQKLEKEVEELNTRKGELEARLSHPETYANAEEFKKTETAYKDAVSKLAVATREYEIVFEKMISLDDELLSS